MISKSCKKLSVLSLLALSNIAVSQTPLVAADGVAFGTGNEDPLLRKGTTNAKDLQLDVGAGGVFSIFSGLDTLPTFKAGEGNSAAVTAGKWYRIAKSNTSANGLRTNALFSLRDSITGGYNSNITFRTGMSDGDKGNMSFNLLSNSSFTNPTFSEVRYLSATSTDEHYLEVKVVASGAVSYSIMENLAEGSWQPVDWVETTAIPAGYTETKYDLTNKLFMVAGETSILNVDRSTGVAIDGDLTLNGSPVMTSANLPFVNSMGDGGIAGAGDFGISLGNDSPIVNDGSLTISNSNRTIGFYDYSKGFLNLQGPDNDTSLSLDPNQFVTKSKFYFQSEEFFEFQAKEKTGGHREKIAEFTTSEGAKSGKNSSLIIANGTSWDNQFSPQIIGNNESSTLNHYGSLSIQGLGTSAQDVDHADDFAVISIGVGVHTGDPHHNHTTWAPFTQKDIFSVGNFGQEPALRIAANSFVGFGTKNPEEQLHLTKNAQIDGDLSVGGDTLTALLDGSVSIGKPDVVDSSIPLKVNTDGSVVLGKPQGDISMGIYGQ